MIHMLQCLCGPQRHAIYGIMYDDTLMDPQDARVGVEALVEMMVEHRIIKRRCEICDKDIKQFCYEDGITKEQNWEKAQAGLRVAEAQQALTREVVQAARKAGRN